MAANCLQFSSACAKTLFNSLSSPPFASKAFKLSELADVKITSTPRFAATQKFKFSRAMGKIQYNQIVLAALVASAFGA